MQEQQPKGKGKKGKDKGKERRVRTLAFPVTVFVQVWGGWLSTVDTSYVLSQISRIQCFQISDAEPSTLKS